jgi:hypothetical protein
MELIQDNGLTWGSLLFLLTVLSGFWLLKTGKPYRTGIFNIHKLIALGASILIILALYLTGSTGVSRSNLAYGLLTFGGFLVIVLFGSGAMLSIGKPDHKAVLLGHRIGAGLAVASVILLLYLRISNTL